MFSINFLNSHFFLISSMIKECDIENLRVSQTNLYTEHYDKYLNLKLDQLIENEEPNEVDAWEVYGQLILADKHHRVSIAYEKGLKKYPLNVSNKEDPFFDMIFLSYIQPLYKKAKEAGVNTISDLLNQEKL